MIFIKNQYLDNSHQSADFIINEIEETANDLCEEALNEAKTRLHPLLHNVELDRLDPRCEFVQAFKSALERKVAQKLADWHLGVQAVYKFEDLKVGRWECWDNSIRLLVMLSNPSPIMRTLEQALDEGLTNVLKRLHWSRFRKCRSVLEIQQVTPREVQRGTCYGAMFHAVYNAPVKVFP